MITGERTPACKPPIPFQGLAPDVDHVIVAWDPGRNDADSNIWPHICPSRVTPGHKYHAQTYGQTPSWTDMFGSRQTLLSAECQRPLRSPLHTSYNGQPGITQDDRHPALPHVHNSSSSSFTVFISLASLNFLTVLLSVLLQYLYEAPALPVT